MTYTTLATRTDVSPLKSSRQGAGIDTFLVHHMASTDAASVRRAMLTGSKEVSANYIITSSGEIWGIVPEDERAWTSGSGSDGGKGAAWDRRSITVEIENATGAPDWEISEAAITAAASLLADLRTRYPITNVLGHRDLYNLYRASYATYCPGPTTVARILAATPTPAPAAPSEEEDEDMKPTVHVRLNKQKQPDEWMLAHPEIGTDLKAGEKRQEGKTVIFRGYMVTTDEAMGAAWARMYARGVGGETSRTDRDGYVTIQAAATRVSLELGARG